MRDMGNFCTWSAAFADYLEKKYGPRDGMEEGERGDAGRRIGAVPASAVWRLAKNLCRHFGDSESFRACERICAELAGLEHRERREWALTGNRAPFGGFGGHPTSD